MSTRATSPAAATPCLAVFPYKLYSQYFGLSIKGCLCVIVHFLRRAFLSVLLWVSIQIQILCLHSGVNWVWLQSRVLIQLLLHTWILTFGLLDGFWVFHLWILSFLFEALRILSWFCKFYPECLGLSWPAGFRGLQFVYSALLFQFHGHQSASRWSFCTRPDTNIPAKFGKHAIYLREELLCHRPGGQLLLSKDGTYQQNEHTVLYKCDQPCRILFPNSANQLDQFHICQQDCSIPAMSEPQQSIHRLHIVQALHLSISRANASEERFRNFEFSSPHDLRGVHLCWGELSSLLRFCIWLPHFIVLRSPVCPWHSQDFW